MRTQYVTIIIKTIEEGAVSFFQDFTASPSHPLEGYYIHSISNKSIYKHL